MQISEYAIVIKAISHGENNAIIKVFTESHGILTGFAKRVKSSKKANIFVAGNALKIFYLQREGTMGTISGEPYKSYMYSCMDSQIKMKLILAICQGLDIMLGGVEKGESGELFKDIMLYLEGIKHDLPIQENIFNLIMLIKKILDFCGYGFRLNKCIVTDENNIDNLTFISPKSAAAVCKEKGSKYANLMMVLPKGFITENYKDISDNQDILNCLKIIIFFIQKNFNQTMAELVWINNFVADL